MFGQTNYLQATNDSNIAVAIQRPTVYAIDWTEHATKSLPSEVSEDGQQLFDIILLTDCVFSVALVPDLMATILKHCGPKTTVYVCHEVRDEVSDIFTAVEHISTVVDQAANVVFLEELSKHFSWKNVNKNKFHPEFTMPADIGHIIIAKPLRAKKDKIVD